MELFTHWHTWEQAEPALTERLPTTTVNAVRQAVAFAARHHGDQRRPTGAPYLEHLLEALEVLVMGAGIGDPEVLCAAVLHDVVEDTACTLADVSAAFGNRVAELVGWVTIPQARPGQDEADVKTGYLRGLSRAPREAILVKLADRASNVQTLRNLPLPRQQMYYAQTAGYIIPLAGAEPWFAGWYATWLAEFSDLAGSSPDSSAPAGVPPSAISSQASNPTG